MKKRLFKEVFIILFSIFLIIFMASFALGDVFINEFLPNGLIEPDSEWVELYNNGSSSVDLANYNITESGASANVTLNGTIPANGFIVLAENFTLFNSTYPNVNVSGIRIVEYGINVASFQLSNTAGNITLYNSSGSKINNVSYSSTSENVSEGRFPDGNESFSTFTAPTPGAKNDNAAPVFNNWVNPSKNTSFIGSLFNVTVNITDQIYTVNTSFMDFNGTNFTMNRSGDILYYLLNTSKYLETAASSTYNITIYFNDSIGLSATDTLFNISIDNTFPNITSPNVSSNSRNFVNPGFVFNASVNASDENLLNVTCLFNGTTVGYFANTSNKTFFCNLTAPLIEDNYTITFTVFDKANNTNTTTTNFTTRYTTSQTLSPADVTITDLNHSSKIVEVNATLTNTGSNTMYDTGVIIDSFSPSVFASATSVSYKSCSLFLNASQSCNVKLNLTINGSLAAEAYTVYWDANWTDNNLTVRSISQAATSTVTISSNPQITTTKNRTATISHNANATLSIYINTTGNANLQNVNITYIASTLPASWLDINPQNFSTISSNTTFDVNVTVPQATSPNNYTGTLYINSSSSNNKTLLLTVEVPTDSSWIMSPNSTTTYSKSSSAGLAANITINNTGNIGQNFSFSYEGSLHFYIWNTSNINSLYVERNSAGALNIYHLSNGPLTSYDLNVTIASQNISASNLSVVSLIQDDTPPVVNITSPANGSYVKNSSVHFNVSVVTETNLSRLEYYINSTLVLDTSNITFSFSWNTTNGSFGDEIYTLKVIAYDSAGNLNSTQINVTVNNTDNNPKLKSNIPAINWTEESNTTINLSNYFQSLDGDSFSYNSTSPNNVTVSFNNNTNIATFAPSANFSGLNYIIINAIDSGNKTTASNNATLNVTAVNDAPTQPILLTPTNNTNVTSSSRKATLTWNASFDVENDQITYFVFFSNNSNNISVNTTPVNTSTTSTSVSFTGLTTNETYFWNVIAGDSSLNSSRSKTFQFTVNSDSNPTINSWQWNNTVTVSSTNTTPIILENITLAFEVTANDTDSDSINFTWYLNNTQKSNVQNYTFNFTNNFTSAGSHNITLIVLDNNSNEARQAWTLKINNLNRNPTLTAISNKTALEDSQLAFNITASDPDNDTLTYTSNHTSITVTKVNNTIATVTWTATNNDVGNNTIAFNVSDGSLTASRTITITVNNSNDAPTITSFAPTENKTIAENIGSQNFNVTLTDVDSGDSATASWFRNTTSIASNSSNVTVTGLSSGIYNITAIVNDTSGAEARYEWNLIVTSDINSSELTSPVLNLNSSQRQSTTNVTVNQSTFGSVDFGNDTLNFSSVVNLEDAFNISNGLISVDTDTYSGLNKSASLVMKGLNFTKAPLIFAASGFESTANNASCSTCSGITYNVSTGILRFNVSHFTTYFTQTNTTNGAPIITSTAVTSATEDDEYEYDVEATDPDGDTLTFSLETTLSGMSIDSSTGLITYTTPSTGTFNVTVNVSDGSLSDSQAFAISVTKGAKLKISDLDVKVDGKSDKNMKNNTKISVEAEPGSKVVFEVELENSFTDDEDLEIEDIDVEITIEDIDDNDDLDEDADEFDLRADDEDTVKIEFKVPLEVDEDTYDVKIEVEGTDENNTEHKFFWDLELEVEKEKHEIRIIRSALVPATIKCERELSISTEIINTGTEDEDDVALEVTSPGLGINSMTEYIELDEGDGDSRLTKLVKAVISSDVAAGTYPVTINTYYGGKLSETETVEVNVDDCEQVRKIKEEVKEEKPKVEIVKPIVTAEDQPAPSLEISFRQTSLYNTMIAIMIVLFIGTAVFVIGAAYIVLKK